MKRGDRALYLVLLAIFLSACAGSSLLLPRGGGDDGLGNFVLEVVSDGAVIESVSLGGTAPGSLIELREGGGVNVLSVNDAVSMISADCPGGDCLRMAPLTSERGAIVCLPHKLVIKLRRVGGKSPRDGEIDAVTR
ncbi:MAG: NusG domain II-containing protein [Synergistaceae bacterium]|jgi:hypothetical protein|nr:NusG domain II-containing protein [Synergistaceae bacterium]